MSTLLLEVCHTGSQQIANLANVTNGQDVEIARTICCALVRIVSLCVVGYLANKLIEVISTSCSEKRKNKLDSQNAKIKRMAALLDKLLDFQKDHYKETSDGQDSKFETTIKVELGKLKL